MKLKFRHDINVQSAASQNLKTLKLLSVFLILFTSCAGRVLGVSAGSAEEKLRAGDVDFIVAARTSKLKQLARIDPAAPFYAALLLEDAKKIRPESEKELEKKITILYTEALKSPLTRAAATGKLVPAAPTHYYDDFKKKKPANAASATPDAPDSPWEEAFRLLHEAEGEDGNTDALAAYFFDRRRDSRAALEIAEWLLAELKALERPPLSEGELAAAAARIAVARRDYGPAWRQFNVFVAAPDTGALNFFMQHPETLNDFGRAIQYGGRLGDGRTLFTNYDKAAAAALQSGAAEKTKVMYTRYLFNYYQGRFYRAERAYEKAAAAFSAALELAPDGEQKDACIWYIIDINYVQKPESIIPYVRKFAPRWSSAPYFDDILDKFAFYSSSKKKWSNLIDIYPSLEKTASDKIRAKYAYIIARALEEKYIKPKAGITAAALLNTAYKQEADYYYRAMAGKRLRKNPAITQFDETGDEPILEEEEFSVTMKFLALFFRFGCARFASVYINEYYESLTIPELRILAQKFTAAGRYGDAIRLVVKYSKRSGFRPSRADLELSYPRAFSGLVERYAKKANMEQNYLYALMRTESIFIPDIVSRAGALGLTQLMPDTGRHMAEILAGNGGPDYIKDGAINLLDPELNIHLGALYFKDMQMRMGSTQTALMAYNGGIGRVRRWKRSSQNMPDDLFAETVEITETREYSKKVIGDASIYQFLYSQPQD